jgi:hypothetical protein
MQQPLSLYSIADTYCQEWQQANAAIKNELLGDEIQFLNEGKMMTSDVNERRKSIQKGMSDLSNQLESIDIDAVRDQVEKELKLIATKVEDLADHLKLVSTHKSNEIVSLIRSDISKLGELVYDFYRGDHFNNKLAELTFALVNGVKDYVNKFSGDSQDFINTAVPMLIRFCGFMNLKFFKAVKAAADDVL